MLSDEKLTELKAIHQRWCNRTGVSYYLIPADCMEALKKLPENIIDSMVTDPPYGWRFMGKAWDAFNIEKVSIQAKSKKPEASVIFDGKTGMYDFSPSGNLAFQAWTTEWAREVYRVLKPGAHILVFCGPRTYHRMAVGVENAGFEVRDQIQWLFGSGFPKSLNIGKAIKEFEGWGTALKPANEPILLARKPLSEKTVAANVLKWGTGGINIDGCRIGSSHSYIPRLTHNKNMNYDNWNKIGNSAAPVTSQGRFPANFVLSHNPDCEDACAPGCAVKILDEQRWPYYSNAVGPSRFFYCAKASKAERNLGCEGLPEITKPLMGEFKDNPGRNVPKSSPAPRQNHHPTVKPLRLMRYLCRLITPPRGVCLDPFLGSGSTGVAALQEGFQFIGIERESEYFKIALARLGGLR